ncbi:hypothetical protein [Paludisphaera rhizosphaerae]|uniref:hypothetical protein n=1 Tax=Paludisphaera rhizosphaerae TaxID=2711216 RepID=UPI0013EDC707|nr:hypothetical protein [Paludisphaera rhizosphaerae]
MTPPDAPRRRWQVGLRTLILLTAAVAVWTSYSLERRRSADLTTRINALKPLARELEVDDLGMIAVVHRQELWYDDNRWEFYLPAGRRYRLCLATRGIERNATPSPKVSTPLEPGVHVVALNQVKDGEDWRVDVLCDGTVATSTAEPKDWYAGTGSSGGSRFSTSRQSAADKPVVLFHRRFMGPRDAKGQSTTPEGPTEGMVLWIEPAFDVPQSGPPPASSDP